MNQLECIPKDCSFAQLHEIFDSRQLAQTLQQHIWPFPKAAKKQVRDCEVKRIYYQPGKECRLIITANIGNGTDHNTGQQLYFGKLISGKDSREIFNSIDSRKLTTPAFGLPVMFIPEWEMILWAYPNDPDLPGLPLMVSDERILALSLDNPKNFGVKQAPVSVTSELKKYVPGRRCGYVYYLWPNLSESRGSKMPCIVFGKAYTGNKGEKAYRIMRQIWESDPVIKNEFIIPRPYSYDSSNKILWQEGLWGRSFIKHSGLLRNLPLIALKIGQRLAALHNTRLDLPQKMTVDFQIEAMQRTVAAIKETLPNDAESCNSISQKLISLAALLEPATLTPVHGSFKFSHILSTEKGIAFIDFDGLNLGDPGYDVGRLIAHLYRLEATGKISRKLTNKTIQNFCESYNRIAAFPLSQERITWFAASHLVSSEIYKAVKRMYPDLLQKLLNIADRLCPS